ncbi:hypothetical protein [Aeromonas caviae]
MARILTKAQLSKLESKSQAELLAIVLDLATHLPLAKKHLINQYLTAEDGNFSLSCGDGILLPLVDQFS